MADDRAGMFFAGSVVLGGILDWGSLEVTTGRFFSVWLFERFPWPPVAVPLPDAESFWEALLEVRDRGDA